MRVSKKGFTLAELLIALAILGVIATFTIPKVLQSGTSGQNKAIAKEAASMVAGAFSARQLETPIADTTGSAQLTPFMNYVRIDTATTFAGAAGTPLQACSATLPCLLLHNGGVLQYDTAQSFGSAGATGAIYFNLDPDGSGSQGRVTLVQYRNGRLTTGQHANPVSTNGATITVQATDPDYLATWD